jgi:hypothetical protein
VLSAYGPAPPPYGLALPDNRFSWASPAVGAELVVICEGEPDWLALSDELAPMAGVVCLTSLSSGFPPWIAPLLKGAAAVVVACHDRHGGKVYDGLYLNRTANGPTVHKLTVAEGNDWSDRHARGALFGTMYMGKGRGVLAPVVDAALERLGLNR